MNQASRILHEAIPEAMDILGPERFDRPEARVLLMAIGFQESRFEHRCQLGSDGRYMRSIARGFWQFESGGGVRGVMSHAATKEHASRLCYARRIPFVSASIHDALAWDDVLAAGFARLNLWWLPQALPAIDDPEEAWRQYISAWRPGAPKRHTWNSMHSRAREMVTA